MGNPVYMAPELVKGVQYGRKVDIWSMGICLYEMAEGELPYENKNPMLIVSTITKQPAPELNDISKWTSDFNDFLEFCLQKDPKSRPNVDYLLTHPFISDFKSAAEIGYNQSINSRLKPMT